MRARVAGLAAHEVWQEDLTLCLFGVVIRQDAVVVEIPSERIGDDDDDALGRAGGCLGDVGRKPVDLLDLACWSAVVCRSEASALPFGIRLVCVCVWSRTYRSGKAVFACHVWDGLVFFPPNDMKPVRNSKGIPEMLPLNTSRVFSFRRLAHWGDRR